MIKNHSSRTKPRPKSKKRPRRKPIDLAAAKEMLKELNPQTAQAARVIALLQSWLDDESGYDEETWPALKKALDEERHRVGARRLFDG
jgi:hypothetical protein